MKNNKRWILAGIIVLLVIAICNYPLSYRIGVNGEIINKKIPFYAKLSGFLYRDWMYKDIVKGVTCGKETDIDKVLAILKWVNGNVKYGVPTGLKVVDDHPLNIIIRQYATKDQMEDIFMILCSYAGMQAGMEKCYNPAKTKKIVLSFVKIDGEWLIFDASGNKYFLNKKGKIASVKDYLNGDMVLSNDDSAIYKEYLDWMKNIDFSSFTRAEEQMPLRRIQAEIKKHRKDPDASE